MSQENVELVRRCVEAINRGGLQAALEVLDEFCDPDVELRAVGRLPDLGRLLRGREAVGGYFAQLFGTFDYSLEVDEFIDAGDAVVVVARQIARGRGSGAEVTNRIVFVYGMRDGKVTYLDAYRTKDDALEAAGLSDQAMSQQNLDVLRRISDAFNRRDLAAFVGCCDPNIELDPSRVLIGTPTYRGHDGIERLFRDMAVAWEELRNEEIFDVVAVGGDDAVLVGEATGRGKTAGVPFAERMAVHVKFTHGQVVRLAWFATKEEALEASGLRE